MKSKVVKRQQASDDTYAIARQIALDNLDAGLRFIEAAERTFEKLGELPGLGDHLPNDVPGFENLRACPIRGFENYLVLYFATQDAPEVIRVVHGSRKINRLLG